MTDRSAGKMPAAP